MKKLKFLIFISFNFWFSYIFSAIPLTTDDIYIVNINSYELETTYEIFKESSENKEFLTIALKSGLTQKIDLGISILYQTYPLLEERFDSVCLGLKFLILEDILSVSVNNELGKGSCFLNLIFSRSFKNLNFHLNVGYNVSEDKNIAGEMLLSSAFEFEYKKFNFVSEILADAFSFQSYLLGIRWKFFEGNFITLGFESYFKDKNKRIIIGLHNEF